MSGLLRTPSYNVDSLVPSARLFEMCSGSGDADETGELGTGGSSWAASVLEVDEVALPFDACAARDLFVLAARWVLLWSLSG